MAIEIRRLTPELADDYVHFFDVTPHSEKPEDDECKCYCVWWCSDDYEGKEYIAMSLEKRRDYAIQCVKDNKIQGYLAYSDGKVVGWCNANTKSKCLKCFCWRRFMASVPVEETSSGSKVKSVFCFMIALEMRRKGISQLLLERVCQDAAQDGFDFVEAYPRKESFHEAKDCVGPAGMFGKSGFTVYAQTADNLVMRKMLK